MVNAGGDDKPKVRLIKGGKDKPRSGVISGKDKHGNAYYRCSCDRCDQLAKLKIRPREGREILCRDCQREMRNAKASARAARQSGKTVYFTECDECLTVCKTSFLPKMDRLFLCNHCKNEEAAEMERIRVAKEEAAVRPPSGETVTEDLGTHEARETRREDGEHNPQDPTGQTGQETDGETDAVKPQYSVPCSQCDRVLQLKFRPAPGEKFTCPNCYQGNDQNRKPAPAKRGPAKPAKKAEDGPETRILYNIDCIKCGKTEVVNFVPRLGSDAICTSCFNSSKQYSKKRR